MLIDEYKTIVCTTNTKETAKRMMKVYANFVEWNRGVKITNVGEESISFDNYDFIMIKEIFKYATKKEFVKRLQLGDFDV